MLNDPVTFSFPWSRLKWLGSDIRGEFTCAGPLGSGAPGRELGVLSALFLAVWKSEDLRQKGRVEAVNPTHSVSQPSVNTSTLRHTFISEFNSGVTGVNSDVTFRLQPNIMHGGDVVINTGKLAAHFYMSSFCDTS